MNERKDWQLHGLLGLGQIGHSLHVLLAPGLRFFLCIAADWGPDGVTAAVIQAVPL